MIKFRQTIFVLVVMLICCSCSYRPDPIRKSDLVRHGVMTGLMIVDWRQTVQIANNPDDYYEKWNFLLKEHPSEREVNQYFAMSYAGKSLAVWLLPKEYRKICQYFFIGLSTVCVGNNLSIGLHGEW